MKTKPIVVLFPRLRLSGIMAHHVVGDPVSTGWSKTQMVNYKPRVLNLHSLENFLSWVDVKMNSTQLPCEACNSPLCAQSESLDGWTCWTWKEGHWRHLENGRKHAITFQWGSDRAAQNIWLTDISRDFSRSAHGKAGVNVVPLLCRPTLRKGAGVRT